MSVLVMTEVPNAGRGLEPTLGKFAMLLQQAPGFILHAARQVGDGWKLTEVWATQADADHFYAAHVQHLLPSHVRLHRSCAEVHTLVRSGSIERRLW